MVQHKLTDIGGIIMQDAKTIKRYRELERQHIDLSECNCFCAFTKKDYDHEAKRLLDKGIVKTDDEIRSLGAGIFGPTPGIAKMLNYYRERDAQIARECDPQEVYFEEYNNHECMISWDGDMEAVNIIIGIFGADAARALTRYRAVHDIEKLIAEYN